MLAFLLSVAVAAPYISTIQASMNEKCKPMIIEKISDNENCTIKVLGKQPKMSSNPFSKFGFFEDPVPLCKYEIICTRVRR